MTATLIEFSLVPFPDIQANAHVFPKPYPANKEIPDWFKTMPTEIEDRTRASQTTRTVKNCIPFLDAMTCGYIIPLATDMSLSVDPTGAFYGSSKDFKFLAIHRAEQVKGAPFEKLPIVKILNPWLIRTPPGYSSLFLPLLNRFGMPLYPFSGLVETDTFYREINFPSILALQPGTTMNLARGTPLVQVIPIKREVYQSTFVPPDAARYESMDLSTRDDPKNYNLYKNEYWERKSYH